LKRKRRALHAFRAIYAPAYQQYEKQDIVKLEEKMACTSCEVGRENGVNFMHFVQSMHQHAINIKIRDDMKLEEKTACTSCISCNLCTSIPTI
jgi:hypothetical protein